MCLETVQFAVAISTNGLSHLPTGHFTFSRSQALCHFILHELCLFLHLFFATFFLPTISRCSLSSLLSVIVIALAKFDSFADTTSILVVIANSYSSFLLFSNGTGMTEYCSTLFPVTVLSWAHFAPTAIERTHSHVMESFCEFDRATKRCS